MSGWWEDEPNGSKAVSLLLRLSALILALASAVMMATADDCTIAGATPTSTAVTYRDYGAFVYLVWANVAAAVLQAAAVYLQLSGAGDDDDDDGGSQVPGVVLVVVDVLAQALLYSSTGAA